jgi:hypothetical protein
MTRIARARHARAQEVQDAARHAVERRIRLRDARCRLCGDRKALVITQILPGLYSRSTAAVLCRACSHDLTRPDARFTVEPSNAALGCNSHLDAVAR